MATDTEEFLDKEAPYGRFANGKPRRSPKGSTVRPPSKRAASRGTGFKPVAPNYQKAAEGGITMLAAMVGLLGRRSPALLADSTVIMSAKKELATAVAETALIDVRVAQLLDKLGTVGPWGKVLEKATPVLAQILTNHGLAPVGTMGSIDPKKLLEAGRAEEVKQNAEDGRLCGHCGSPEIVAMDQEGNYYCQKALDEATAENAIAEAAAAVAGNPDGLGL